MVVIIARILLKISPSRTIYFLGGCGVVGRGGNVVDKGVWVSNGFFI